MQGSVAVTGPLPLHTLRFRRFIISRLLGAGKLASSVRTKYAHGKLRFDASNVQARTIEPRTRAEYCDRNQPARSFHRIRISQLKYNANESYIRPATQYPSPRTLALGCQVLRSSPTSTRDTDPSHIKPTRLRGSPLSLAQT